MARILSYPERNYAVLLAFMAFVVARYIQVGARMDILAAIRFEFLLGIVVILLAIGQMAQRQPVLTNSRPLSISIGVLFLIMLTQLPFAADPVAAQKIFWDRVVKFAMLTFLMVVMIESPRHLRLFIYVFLFSLFYITQESVHGLITGGLYWQNQGIMRLHGAVPMYIHPNSLGGVAMGALPFVVFLFRHSRSFWVRLFLLALTVTSIICVIYSGSRTAYLGLLSVILWWWFQSRNKKKFMAWLIVLGALGLQAVPEQYIGRFQSIGGQEKEGKSSEARMEVMGDAVAIFAENPFGVGIASFPAVRAERFGKSADTHNLYLEVATNIGIHGLAAFVALVVTMMASLRRSKIDFSRQLRQLRRLARQMPLGRKERSLYRQHIRDIEMMIAVAQATAGFIVIRLVQGMFGMDLYEVYWWFGAGVAIVLRALYLRSKNILRRLESRAESTNKSVVAFP